MNNNYKPPYTITPSILRLVAQISETVGQLSSLTDNRTTPRLRRENRLRTIQASLAIENNTLSLEQVTAVIDGKRVSGSPREIQEVRNAFTVYEKIDVWIATSCADLLEAHGILMGGLVDDAGQFRSGNVGVFRGRQLIHMAPQAARVPHLMNDLLLWLKTTDVHPVVASCVFHYELEFIHPFSDGNGRMGRLWQTLILNEWMPMLANLSVESIIYEKQEAYYQSLATSDEKADSTSFIDFMLQILIEVLRDAMTTDQVTDQVSRLIKVLAGGEMGSLSLMSELNLTHRPSFRKNYLTPALYGGFIERTQPDSPRSPTQRYRLTKNGRRWLGEYE